MIVGATYAACASALAAWSLQKNPCRHRAHAAAGDAAGDAAAPALALASADVGIGIGASAGAGAGAARVFFGFLCVCLPVAHPGNYMNSPKSCELFPQHDHRFVPSWNVGAPG